MAILKRAGVVGAALLLAVCSPSASAQIIPSALPSIGKPVDIRDVRNITAPAGKLVVTASHVLQTATKFFSADGTRRELPLDQTFRVEALPIFATYGLTDRCNVGAGLSLVNSIERKLSVLNFVPGASILGQPLPVGGVIPLELQGDGAGDLNLTA